MHVCVVSFKPCWQRPDGTWVTDGGFPLQMAAITAMFDDATLVVVRTAPRAGGLPLPSRARIVGLDSPVGADARRKVSMLGRLPRYVMQIVPHVRAADVVHVPLPGDVSALGLLIALASRKRLIARYGSSWADTAQTTRPQRFVKAVMRRFAGGRNVMLAVGSGPEPPAPGMGWVFSTALTQAELDAIHPDVDRGLGRPPKLVAIGRLSSEKGVHVLVRAIARLKGTPAGEARLEILGDGPARSALEQECRALGLDDRISFKGYLNRPELSAALQDADLCVHPALTESLSKAWLDAMAHGVPVLSTDVGVARMVMGGAGERGWLVPPGDDRALADGIVAALDHAAAWPELRRRCRTFVEAYTLERWASDIGRFCAAQWGGQLTEGRLRL